MPQSDLEVQWQQGVSQVTGAFRLLPPSLRQRLETLCGALKGRREALQSLVAGVGAALACADCGGECCVAGKYHFTRVDLLVYLCDARPLFTPLFDNGMCPYLGPTGCLIPAACRPFNCITFNCERIEDLLAPEELAEFYALERALRTGYSEIRALFPDDSMYGALIAEAPLQQP